jgi:hypothetical protein
VSHRRFDGLLAGAVLYFATEARPLPIFERLPLVTWKVLAAATTLLLWIFPHVVPVGLMSSHGFVALWALSALLCLFASQGRGIIFGSIPPLARILEYLGARSFGLYLGHFPVSWLCTELELRARGGAWDHPDALFDRPSARAIFYLASLVFVTELVHRELERPLREFGRRLGLRLRNGRAAEGPGDRERRWVYAATGCGAAMLVLFALVAWSELRRPDPAVVSWTPQRPSPSDRITIRLQGTHAGALAVHWGVTLDGRPWQTPAEQQVPPGSHHTGSTAIETPMDPAGSDTSAATLGPFDGEPRVDEIRFVIHCSAHGWHKQEGRDFIVALAGTAAP